MAAPEFHYCASQRLRLCTPVRSSSIYAETCDALGFVSGWRDVAMDGTKLMLSTTILCEAHHAPALLTPAGLAKEHTRYVRHLLGALGNYMDTFTGAVLDLKKQTATVQ